ncbi:uncharacterized mitochondrial protein-like protein [Tanacetum coccineum]
MHDKFQMSSMGELNFFLGLQVKQREDGIFTSQDKYVAEILRKFGFTDVRTASTPIDTEKPLLKDSDVYACARFQVTPKVSHSHAVKRIFRYLKGQPKLGLLYPRNSPFDLVAYSDNDYAGASLDRKSTIGDLPAKALDVGRLGILSIWQINRGRDTKIPQSSGPPEKVGDEAVHKKLGDIMERVATTASSLEEEQDSGNNNRTQSMATLNEPSPWGTGSGSGPRDFIRHETEVPQPSSPTQTHVADEAASTGVDVRHGGAATTVSSLDVGQGSEVQQRGKDTGKAYSGGNEHQQTKNNNTASYKKRLGFEEA